MSQISNGMNYAPSSAKPKPVVQPGEFSFAAAHLDHGHIYGQCNGLVEAGAELKYVYEPDPEKLAQFQEQYPTAKAVSDLHEILDDPDIRLVAAAAIPSERGPLGCRVMQHGKDYFTDKCPFTTLEQLADAKAVVEQTQQKYMVYYSERLHVESTYYAGELIRQGAIGDVVQMTILGPHRLNKPSRPDWFFEKAKYGGILTDIASHQFDQFLVFSGSSEGKVNYARVDNFNNPDKPEFEDFGEANLMLDMGLYAQKKPVSCYSRVDWFTPDGMRGWGDGRMFIVGTEGSIEIRKYFDIGRSNVGDLLFVVNGEREEEVSVAGKLGFPFFGEFILDCLNRTEQAMTQEHAFKASELSLKAQLFAERNGC